METFYEVEPQKTYLISVQWSEAERCLTALLNVLFDTTFYKEMTKYFQAFLYLDLPTAKPHTVRYDYMGSLGSIKPNCHYSLLLK